MRDSFGGVFMIRLMLVFLFIYVSFTAISLNYAKAFRIKNKVIDFVEQNQILDLDSFFATGNGQNIANLNNIMESANYNVACKNGNGSINTEALEGKKYCYHGVVIEQTGEDKNAIYYDVSTYADWNLGIFNLLFKMGQSGSDAGKYVSGGWQITDRAKVVKQK